MAWSRYEPDGMLADMLAEATARPPAATHDSDIGYEILERVGAWEKIIAWAQASQQVETARFMQHAERTRPRGLSWEQNRAGATAEVGLMLRISQRTAESRVNTALELTQRLPDVQRALASGRISLSTARTLAEETVNLPVLEARSVVTAVLVGAVEQTTGQVRAAVRRAVLRCDPEAVRRRCAQAIRERGVWLQDEPDGMASLHARLPASDAVGCFAVLDQYARRAGGTPGGDTPGIDARRADVLVDLIHGVDPGRVKAQIRVTVPISTLLGLDDQPGELAGYGPIPADMGRRLAADGTWRRLLTDPASGALLDYGTTRYRPPAHLAEHVQTRDQTCRFPGCRVPAHRCDLDHVVPFDPSGRAGPTSETNLAALCRTHHQVKQHSGWALAHPVDGTLTWWTPSGHIHTTRPPPQS